MDARRTDALERFLTYSDSHRMRMQAAAVVLILAIAGADARLPINISLGFLYIVPVLLVSSTLKRIQLMLVTLSCALLLEVFHPLSWQTGAIGRICSAFGAFTLASFFVSELERKRQQILLHLREVERQSGLRKEAEQQLRILIETSPLAIVSLSSDARIQLANHSAHEMFGFEDGQLAGAGIVPLLPILERLLHAPHPGAGLRTTMECKGHRRNGDVFLAHVWLSTYETNRGPALAAAIWDASENLRDREGTGLDSMMETSRILIGAFSHEIRNLASAGTTTQDALAAAAPIASLQEFQTLAAILKGLERLSSAGLRLAAGRTAAVADLGTVLDEARIVIEPDIREIGGTVTWQIAPDLPLVRADQNSLLQVLLNLARNSQRALANSLEQRLDVDVSIERDLVLVRFRDTGPGVAQADDLFRPFQPGATSAGLGLYVSRAILRSNGGDLRYEPQPRGSCFCVELWPAEESQEG